MVEKNKYKGKKDRVFSVKKEILDFEFNDEIAEVFDDMLQRSIPFYNTLQLMVASIVCKFSIDHTNIYDLGCSTGTTILSILKRKDLRKVKIIGIDYSEPMLDLANKKLKDNYKGDNYEIIFADLNENIDITNASVVILILTLQFIRPVKRELLINKIYNGLKHNGCIVLVEKVLSESKLLNKLFLEYYYEFKKNRGYSKLEISQKREALENILIPYTINENLELLTRNGFKNLDIFFKWYNFAGFIGVKK